MNLHSPYLIPTLLGFTAVKRSRMVREREAAEADVASAAEVATVGPMEVAGLMPMYWTATCWRSKWGFLGLRARRMRRRAARRRRARKERRRKRQQQQPLKEAEEEGRYGVGGGGQ